MKTNLIPALFLALTATVNAESLPTIVAKPHTVNQTFPVESLVEAVQQATVGARISGRILEVKADAGQQVKKGEVLMHIDAREAEEAARAADAQYANAKLNYERNKSLKEQKFVSQAAVDKAKSDYDAATANRAAASASQSHPRPAQRPSRDHPCPRHTS